MTHLQAKRLVLQPKKHVNLRTKKVPEKLPHTMREERNFGHEDVSLFLKTMQKREYMGVIIGLTNRLLGK
jgi:hypothetical protein